MRKAFAIVVLLSSLSCSSASSGVRTLHWEFDWDDQRPVTFQMRVDGGEWMSIMPERDGDVFSQMVAPPKGAKMFEIRSCTNVCLAPVRVK